MAKDRVDRDDEDLVRLYLTDIGQYTLLTKDDEVRLAKAIEFGKEAIAQLDAGGKEITASRRRELRRTARQGEEAERQRGAQTDVPPLDAHVGEVLEDEGDDVAGHGQAQERTAGGETGDTEFGRQVACREPRGCPVEEHQGDQGEH